jgi:hypothetical protein
MDSDDLTGRYIPKSNMNEVVLDAEECGVWEENEIT